MSPDYVQKTKAITGFLAIVVPLCSTLSGCLTYQFVHYISQISTPDYHISALIASLTLAINLSGMVFDIMVFRSFVHHALIDSWPLIHVQSWQLITLSQINFLTATIGRIYFARLASTMLRHPRRFLCASGVLLLSSTSGSILQGVHHGMRDEPGFYPDLHQLFLSHFLWLASATLWDCLICGALLYNFSSFEKRFKFGSMNGKTSFGIALVFESFLIATFFTCFVFVVTLVIDIHLRIDEATASVFHAGLESLGTRFYGVSMLCSLQHKIYVHRNLGSKPIIISDQRLISKNPMPISDLIIVPEVIESGLRGQPSDFNLDLDGQDREMSKDGIHVHSVVSSFKESGGEPQDLTTKKKLLGISQNQIRSISQEIQFCL